MAESFGLAGEFVPRHVEAVISEALKDTRVVLLLGARQTGKSTLARHVAAGGFAARTVTLDDASVLGAANQDPIGFVASLERPIVIDEVQRSPELLLAIKELIDRDPRPGQFLLTGSANLLTAPRIYEALTGRTEIVRLWPFAQSEIERSRGNLVDLLFAGSPPTVTAGTIGREAFVDRAVAGGYPNVYKRAQGRRDRWFESYLTSLVERDLREISDIRRVEDVPTLLRLLAGQSANLFNASAIGKAMGVADETVRSYTGLLETVFLVKRVRAWRPSISRREVSTPKMYLADSGLLAYLLGADATRAASDDQVTGKLFETFAAMEIARLLDAGGTSARQYHFRDRVSGDEIDIVLESRSGAVVCIECKAAATVRPSDYRAIVKLRDTLGERFVSGVVLYTGRETTPLSDRLWAVPVSALWIS